MHIKQPETREGLGAENQLIQTNIDNFKTKLSPRHPQITEHQPRGSTSCVTFRYYMDNEILLKRLYKDDQ